MSEAAAPDVSFVVPTYREEENLPHLVEHVRTGLAASGLSWELIVANDESGDGTARVCAELAKRDPVRLLNRTRDRGLALAVIDGAKLARGTYIVVMDGDLSHPSAAVPAMVEILARDPAVKMAVGSRNVADASTDAGWPLLRHLATFVATTAARPLTSMRDPMSGFFALRRADWPAGPLRPIGYKIGLELAVRGGFGRGAIAEVPIHFTDRQLGKSKMGLRELHNYCRHLFNLYRFRWPAFRVLMQGGIGAVGYFVDLAGFFLLQAAGLGHLAARLVSYTGPPTSAPGGSTAPTPTTTGRGGGPDGSSRCSPPSPWRASRSTPWSTTCSPRTSPSSTRTSRSRSSPACSPASRSTTSAATGWSSAGYERAKSSS